MPFENITGKYFDSGDYPECLRRVIAAIDLPGVRRRQAETTGPLRIGFGCSIFCEQAAHGTSVYAGWGIPMVPGFEQAVARMTPDGNAGVARASAQVARQLKPNARFIGVRQPQHNVACRHQHARRAIAALQCMLRRERGA